MTDNPTESLHIGLTGQSEIVVQPGHTALRWGSGGVEVLSTPQLVALVESAALSAVDRFLPEGWVTGGTRVAIEHVAATPLGLPVTARAMLVDIAGRRLTFEVEANDPTGLVGCGTHERAIVNRATFVRRAETKAASPSAPADSQQR